MAQEGDGSGKKEDWAAELREDKMFVGLCGAAGSGKSTVSDYLIDRHDFERVSFAAPLKAMLRAIPGITWEHTDGKLKEVPCELLGGQTPRYAMQHLGTGWGRETMDHNIWVNIWKDRVKLFKRVVVDDVRFPNEVDAIHSLSGKVILIDRGIQWAAGNHASEHWHKLAWDRGISNAGSVDDLCRSIEAVLWPAWPLEAAPA